MKPKIWKIWIGENPIPEQFKQYTDTWGIIDAEIITVTNDNVNEYIYPVDFKTICERFLWNNTIINHYIRYYLMYKYGGIYLDLDVEAIKDSEIWYSKEPIFFLETINPVWANNHVMICNEKHNDIYYSLAQMTHEIDLNDPKIEINTGPGLVSSYLFRRNIQVSLYDPEYTTPWNWNEKPDRSRITEKTIAVHHFTHSWKK